MRRIALKGVIPPVPTIVDGQGNLDETGMGKVIDRLVASDVQGLLFLGSGGEFCHMGTPLRKEVAEFVISHVNGRLPVLIGVGAPGTAEVVDLGRHARENGADGVLVINPYYALLSQEHLEYHYRTIAERLDLPIFLYNFPALTGQDINIPLIQSLAKSCPNIVGIKDTVDTISHTRSIITTVKAERSDFMVFAGFDEYLLDNLILGGDGAIPASSNIAPEICCGIHRAVEARDMETAITLQRRLAQLVRLYALEPAHFGVIKEAMRMMGLDISTAPLPPITVLSEEKKTILRTILERSGLSPHPA
ncbi:dihydrodipicolinate synthase family protein [Telmatospirillum siberiense]|uniref:Dihydrodipicolinate synthase family protein n=1 Tax=Telmatospirillum siberiense TaxID=382514 RepID=A0A2N3PT18_9PROT|nr:dihydrodipicolinate synthase family protein [Telmatospirillum siberiense]PKU23516.1 dihydrodipicolinate synthase family protein [Telmatospirillum siberiense]